MISTAAHRRLLALGTLVLAVLALLPAAPAQAAGCGARAVSQPFSRFGDQNAYFPATNGGFESGTNGWTVSGGAKAVSGNETYYAGSGRDRKSLLLPVGASATSSWMCITKDDPTVRFFARSTSTSFVNVALLNVEAQILGASGTTVTHYFGMLTPSEFPDWSPSSAYSYGVWLDAPWLYGGGDTVSVRFRFWVQGNGGTWNLDDVYVDPFKGE